MTRILIVDNDDGLIHFLSRIFVKQGYEVTSCTDGDSALQRLAMDGAFNVVLLDYKMPGLNGLETLVEIKGTHPATPVVIMTAHGTTETAIEAMKLGAYDYLLKPFDADELRRTVAEAATVSRLMREVVTVANTTSTPHLPAESGHMQIVGSHRKMQSVFKLIGQVAEKDVTVLITGESGTGKELVARALYHHSHRKDRPFIGVNCASIPDTLFESELFGYEQGAFTGADRTYLGKFERCNFGTLFFDEIGDMSLSTQAKVLRVLQEGEFERLGSTEPLHVDVRILSATNKNLEKEVEAGRFRQDLYYRLRVISIHLPPLRERLEDIPSLVNYFVARFAQEYSKPIRFVSDSVMARFQSCPWPGNIRELENCLRRAVLTCKGDVLQPEHTQVEGDSATLAGAAADGNQNPSLAQRIETLAAEMLRMAGPDMHTSLIDMVEEALVMQALEKCDQNQVHTARLLGISRNTLRHRIKKYRPCAPDL